MIFNASNNNLALSGSSPIVLKNNLSFYPMTPAQISGCVGYWNLNTSGTFVNSSVSSDTGSVLGNITFSNGRVGSGCYNAGSDVNSNIAIANPIDYKFSLAKTTNNHSGVSNGLLSLSYWANIPSAGSETGTAHILGKSSSTLGHEWAHRVQNYGISGQHNLFFFGSPDATQSTSFGISNVLHDRWHHFAWCGSKNEPTGITIYAYMDGKLLGSQVRLSYPEPLGPNRNEPVRLFMRGSDPRSVPGYIDEFAIYNRVLNQTDVSCLYNLGSVQIFGLKSSNQINLNSSNNNLTLKEV